MALAVGRAMDKSAELLRGAAQAGDAEAFRFFGLALDAGDEQAASFRDMAAEQLAREQTKQQQLKEAVVHVATDAKRRQRFPKPRIVKSG